MTTRRGKKRDELARKHDSAFRMLPAHRIKPAAKPARWGPSKREYLPGSFSLVDIPATSCRSCAGCSASRSIATCAWSIGSRGVASARPVGGR